MRTSSPIAKYHQVELTLAARIREGLYDEAGLPGERVLAAEFAVARVTVRTALERLEDRGLVVRAQRRGTIAASGRAPKRRLLREHVDRFLDRGRKDRRRVLRYGVIAATPRVAHELETVPGARVLRVVRLRTDEVSPLTYTEVFVPDQFASGISRKALERKAFMHLLEESGVKVGSAEQRVSCEGASLEVSEALGVPLQAPVLKFVRVVKDRADRPIQLLLGWYRADRFEVRMQLSRAEDATKIWVEYR